jgi:putative DNA primase/helicase
MVVVAAYEPVQPADYTSGLVRRRLAMTFHHRPAVPRALLSWHAGTWQEDLAPEIPGGLNWVLALPDAQMEALLQQTTTLVPSFQATLAQSLVDTNPLAEWANQSLLLNARTDAEGHPMVVVNVGHAHKLDDTNAYEHQGSWLYPHYRTWVMIRVGIVCRLVARPPIVSETVPYALKASGTGYGHFLQGAFGHSDISRSRCWYRTNT